MRFSFCFPALARADRPSAPPGRDSFGALMAALAILALPVLPRDAGAQGHPQLLDLLGRVERYISAADFGGILTDPRYASNPSEAARMSVVCQVLGYTELFSTAPSDSVRERIRTRANFLVDHFDGIRSGTAFDGMLALALLRAFETTGDTVYAKRGQILIANLKALPMNKLILNPGLMAALALARHSALSGDEVARNRALDIVAATARLQNADGSFPHYCAGSSDLHYTSWMGLELIELRRMLASAQSDTLLQRIVGFLKGRVGDTGESDYVDECPSRPECTGYYYSIMSGCPMDYDTRGWINELGYNIAVLGRFGEAEYLRALGFLASLESGGAFADKWTAIPSPSDPIYPWASASPSLIRTSIIFWSLAVAASMPAGTPLQVVASRAARLPSGSASEDLAEARARSGGLEWTTVDSLMIAGIAPEPQGWIGGEGTAGRTSTAESSVARCACSEAFTVSVGAIGQGTVSKLPNTSSYGYGTTVELSATPRSGHSFVSWDGDTAATENPLSVVIHRNRAVVANFTRSLAVEASGEGTVAFDPRQTAYMPGTAVTLAATPNPGHEFVAWSGDTSAITNPLTVGMGRNRVLRADFTCLLTVAATGAGEVTRTPERAVYRPGTTVTLTAVPAEGWVFSGWLGDVSSPLPRVNLTMSGSRNVTARFDQPLLYLGRPAPNPAVGMVRMRLVLTGSMRIRAAIHDLAGRRVRTLLSAVEPVGSRNLEWDGHRDDGRRVAPGLYLLRLESPHELLVRRIVVL